MANYPDFVQSTGYGHILGLGGINCRHSFFGVTETQKPAYSPEQLKKMREQAERTKEYEGKKYTQYDASQKMRSMENAMRKTRQRAAAFKAAETVGNYKKQKKIYADQRAEYKKFAEHFGMKPQFERVYADGIGRI